MEEIRVSVVTPCYNSIKTIEKTLQCIEKQTYKNIEYIIDEESESIMKTPEYFRFAAETLFDGEGDCDCKSVLAYRIFKALSVDVELAFVKTGKSKDYNHVAVVLRKSPSAVVPIPDTYKEYEPGMIFCETTGFGHVPGLVPDDVDQSTICFLK